MSAVQANTDAGEATAAPTRIEINYVPYGAARELFECRDKELCLDGAAGTGKTVAALNKIHACLMKYAGARALVARKTNTALAGSALVTYREHVLRDEEGVRWFGGNRTRPAAYHYPNGSELIVNGLDKPEKVKSTEFDLAYINEATECTEEDAEFVRSRLRHGKMPYQQLIMDDNPGAPTHWLNQRMLAGKTTRLCSRHQDNPRFYDRVAQDWTPEGREYIEGTLGGLTGVRRLRLKDGIWASAEGTVYDEYNADIHLIPRRTIPKEWPRYWVVDFGYNDPFVCQFWAVGDDGALYRYREIYWTGRIVEEHARDILRLAGYEVRGVQLVRLRDDAEPLPRAILTDHDAEDRATLEKHLRLTTTAAFKSISPGIQAVKSRLMVNPATQKPRLYLLQDSLVQRDPELTAKKLPACTEEEFDSYVWDTRGGRRSGDEPVDKFNHGMDTTRYVVAHFDCHNNTAQQGPSLASLPRAGLWRPA